MADDRSESSNLNLRRAGAAAITLLVLPGLGHGVFGRAGRGAAWVFGIAGAALSGALLSAIWVGALLAIPLLVLVVVVAAAIDAARLADSSGRHTVRGWVALGGAAWATFLVGPVVLALALRFGVLEAFKIPSYGMCPTLAIGDHVFVDKTAYRRRAPARGDIVVYRRGDADFIHRIVGVAGDDLTISEDGSVVLNGSAQRLTPTAEQGCEGALIFEEELGRRHRVARGDDAFQRPTQVKVPRDHVFVLGDFRTSSADSRMHGGVPTSALAGPVRWIWLRNGAITWQPLD